MDGIREIIDRNGGNKKFSEKYNISINTIEKWKSGKNKPPDYVTNLFLRIEELENKLNN